MSDNRFTRRQLTDRRRAFRVPERCTFCDASDGIRVDLTITDDAVVFAWQCDRCGRDWPITEEKYELIDRRRRLTDRRARPPRTR